MLGKQAEERQRETAPRPCPAPPYDTPPRPAPRLHMCTAAGAAASLLLKATACPGAAEAPVASCQRQAGRQRPLHQAAAHLQDLHRVLEVANVEDWQLQPDVAWGRGQGGRLGGP